MSSEEMLSIAYEEAKRGFLEGGIPIGSALFVDGVLVGRGRNQRVQKGSQVLHGEMDCLENAGRHVDLKRSTLVTTLSPCMMCAGTIVQFGIPRVIIGENSNFGGNEAFLHERGVEVIVLHDPKCQEIMSEFIQKHPDVWFEDIGN